MKKIQKISLLLFFFVSISWQVFAQGVDSNLANKYYEDGEFGKAVTLYESLFRETGYKSYRDMYVGCLFALKEYDTAEKFLKKEIKKNKTDFYLLIDLHKLYLVCNRISEAKEQFQKVLEASLVSENSVPYVASSYITSRNYQLARDVYYAAAKKFTNSNYDYEIANTYSYERDYENMMDYYLNSVDTYNLGTLEYRLTFLLSSDTDGSLPAIIEKKVIERLQKKPQSLALNNLLIWTYIQTGKNKLALNQLIAFNKRTSSNYSDILDFGVSMSELRMYDLATEAFEYIIQKGKSNKYYNAAYIEFLNLKYNQTVSQINPSEKDLKFLDSTISVALKELPISDTYKILITSATVKAFYLNKCTDAISLISNAIKTNRYNIRQVLELKLLLGDIYLLNSNPWDATLAYAQIEKSSADAIIVDEARFRKAKLAYYIGEFKWSQAQLDVLKAGTSNLISNDAMELSLFITENFDMDTTESTMRTFARADFYSFSKQYQRAFNCLDSIAENCPHHSLMDDVYYKKAEIFEATNRALDAADLYKKVFTDFSFDILADNALYRYARICDNQKKVQEAKDAYFKLISDYPGSIFTVDARKFLRVLNDASGN